MLFARKSLGVEISSSGIACAVVSGKASAPRLERVAYAPLAEGTLRPSLRELNVHDPQQFCDRLRNAHNLLLTAASRVSVTLPETVGRILLLDHEGRFKSRQEGLDIIRWKLKKSIPFDVAETHLDYQQLRIRENGDLALLVTLVSRTVIGQYEELFTSAGFSPVHIDFNVFNLYRTFERRLAAFEDALFVYFYENSLGIMVFSDGIPEFIRIKDLPGALAVDSRVFMEINSSLLVHRERFPDWTPSNVFCLAAPDVAREFCDMVGEAATVVPQLLETKAVVTPADEAPADQDSLFPFSAAIGAALRSL